MSRGIRRILHLNLIMTPIMIPHAPSQESGRIPHQYLHNNCNSLSRFGTKALSTGLPKCIPTGSPRPTEPPQAAHGYSRAPAMRMLSWDNKLEFVNVRKLDKRPANFLSQVAGIMLVGHAVEGATDLACRRLLGRASVGPVGLTV